MIDFTYEHYEQNYRTKQNSYGKKIQDVSQL